MTCFVSGVMDTCDHVGHTARGARHAALTRPTHKEKQSWRRRRNPRQDPQAGGKGKSKQSKPEQVQEPGATPVEVQAEEAKPQKATPKKAKEPSGRLGCLDAAAQVLKDKGEPMRAKEMITAMAEAKLWTSTAPTPHATLYSAILREITTKGSTSRFR
jgi:HB1/ASXL restriction endonuclease-like protein with HTH domain